MKKTLSICITALLSLALLVSCAEKLPEGLDNDSVSAAAADTINMLVASEYDKLADTLNAEMITALTKDVATPAKALEDIWQPLTQQLGEFSKIDKTTVGAKSGYAVAIVLAKFENGDLTFTLSYDKDLKLAGLFMK